MKEIKIEVPEGYEIDKENSTFEKIVLKKKSGLPMSWYELSHIKGYYVSSKSTIEYNDYIVLPVTRNVWPTKELAEAALALSQLLQLRDRWNGDWKADYSMSGQYKFVIGTYFNTVCENDLGFSQKCHPLVFKSPDLRHLFFKTFKDLIETAKPLL